jgi:hypothetical protein
VAQTFLIAFERRAGYDRARPATRDTFVAAYNDLVPLTSTQRDELHRGVSTVLNHFGWT